MDSLNPTIDVLDRFSKLNDDKERWASAKSLMGEIGANALNYGLVDTTTETPVWVRSSMSDAWLDAYVNEGLYTADPFLPHLKHSLEKIVAKGGTLEKQTAQTETALELNHGLKDAGYATLIGMPFSGGTEKLKKMVTFCSDSPADEFLRSEMQELIYLSATAIAAFVDAPALENSEEVLRFRSNRLSDQEKRVLSLLASGKRNIEIAWSLDVAEVTVRKHLISVRRKLGAATREQAVAIREGLLEI